MRVTGNSVAVADRTESSRPLTVLMVTGAYFPELSGGGLQARALVRQLRGAASFIVLTTSIDPRLPARSDEDGVTVRRVYVNMHSRLSRLSGGIRLLLESVSLVPRVDIVNVHGFSRKAVLFAALSRIFRKAFALTLQTGGVDEPRVVQKMGRAAYWAYSSADLYFSVSPSLTRAYVDAGFPSSRLRQVSNAVDIERFRPPGPGERAALREELGLPQGLPLALFVGFFSRDKRPHLLYDAWSRAVAAGARSGIVFIGSTSSTHGEVDADLAASLRERARTEGVPVFFVESTLSIEKFFRAVDVYVLPSIREGLPIALLEAMSSGLPCVATRLPGSTDVLIDHGVTGLLVEPDDAGSLADSIGAILGNGEMAARLGVAAREKVIGRYSIQGTAGAWLDAYRMVARA